VSWPYYPELLATPVPRYTSYPTAAVFHDGVGASEMEAALMSVPDGTDISLYVHFPFCREICWYCGCNTGAANRAHRLEAYLEALNVEIGLIAGRLGGRGLVRRIAFGGGSPNAMPVEAFVALAERVRQEFGAHDPIVSVELDPRGFDHGWAAALAAIGAEQASLGVQSFDPDIQRAIGRIQPRGMVGIAVDLLRAAGISSLNFDLMYGLPCQGLGELEATLRTALAMNPDRIALFGYAHVPDLIPRQRRIDAASLPSTEARFRQAAFGHAFLTARGYEPVGFDHFAAPADPLAVAAREGRLRRNFQGFTDDPSEILIGLGASAISQFPEALIQNEKNAGRYRMLTLAGRLPAARGVERSPEDRVRGGIIEDLLCRGIADTGGIGAIGQRERLRRFEERGLLGWAGDRLTLSADALPYARAIAAAFDAWRQPGVRQCSNAV
jgi:oxygen-independent coproporphyrinogen-3 oxidase